MNTKSGEARAESTKAREIPPDEMAGIIADLRTLAAAVEVSPGTCKDLARGIEDRLGAIIGRFFMVETAEGTLRRELDLNEKPFVAVIEATMTLVWYVWYGKPPADCGAKLGTLADDLERRFKAMGAPGAAASREKPWSDEPLAGYIFLSEAVARYCDMPKAPKAEQMSRAYCKTDGEFDYMKERDGRRRCKVNEEQFAAFAMKMKWSRRAVNEAKALVTAWEESSQGHLEKRLDKYKMRPSDYGLE